MSNCWGKGSFDFIRIKNIIEKAPFVNHRKLNKLWKNIDIKVCKVHDKDFDIWTWFIDYLKANHRFWVNLLKLLHWTTTVTRINIYFISVGLLTLFWFKFFNWKMKDDSVIIILEIITLVVVIMCFIWLIK